MKPGTFRIAYRLLGLALMIGISVSALAEIPQLIQYQGKATDKVGFPISGTHEITFRLYDAVSDGSMEWEETHTAVPIENGLFSVLLGGVTPLDLPFDEPYWLSIEIDSDGEMEPRHQLTSVPYAYSAQEASRAEVSRTVQIYSIPHYIVGCELEYVDADSIRVTPGSFDLGGQLYTRTSYSEPVVASNSSNWLDGGPEPSDSWIYVYLEPNGSSWAPRYALDAPNVADTQGNTEGVLRYLEYSGEYYRCVGAARNEGSALVRFYQRDDFVFYDEYIEVARGHTNSAWVDVDCSPYMPAFSRLAVIWFREPGGSGIVRTNGSASTIGIHFQDDNTEDEFMIATDATQVFERRSAVNAWEAVMRLTGFYVGDIR